MAARPAAEVSQSMNCKPAARLTCPRAIDAVNAVDVVELRFDEAQLPGGGIAAERHHRISDARGDVELLAVGAERKGCP